MRIGIDCDGVLRDFIPDLINQIKTDYPNKVDLIKTPNSWEWESWLPFWTEDQTEGYVFSRRYLELFGPDANPIKSSLEDWPKLKVWAKEHDHELILVSAQRDHCIEPTEAWLQRWGFMFDEYHFTKEKWSIDVDVLIDDSPEKLDIFKDRSVAYGNSICYKQTWNQDRQKKYMTIDRLSDIMTRVFG